MRAIGMLQVLASGVGFGFLGIFGKWAYELGITPGELLSFRFVVASVILGLGLLIFRPRWILLSRSHLIAAVGLGVFGYAVFASFYFAALHRLSASLTVLLLYTYPVLVSVGAWLWLGERLSRATRLALPLASLGLVLLLWGEIHVQGWVGLLFGFGSAVCYAGYILVSSRFLKGANAVSAGFYVMLAAAIALSLIHLRDPARSWSVLQAGWMPISLLAVVSTVLPITLFLAGLQKLTGAETSILSTAEPVTAILSATWILGERLSWLQVAGALLVLGILVGLARARGDAME